MSIFQPNFSSTNEANSASAPLVTLKGRWADMNFVPAITGIMLALGVSRVGTDALVQDLHSGGAGVFLLLASIAAYFFLNAFLKRDASQPYATGGVFRFSRNPAYLAFFLPLAALAYFDAMTAVASTVIYVLAMNLLVIQKQESELKAEYGADFSAYCATTPRWFA